MKAEFQKFLKEFKIFGRSSARDIRLERVNVQYDVLGILPVPISKNSVTALTLVD